MRRRENHRIFWFYSKASIDVIYKIIEERKMDGNSHKMHDNISRQVTRDSPDIGSAVLLKAWIPFLDRSIK